MSSEIFLAALTLPIPEGDPLPGSVDDPVLQTAGDRPDEVSLPALADPAADHEDDEVSRRRADVEIKHDRIRRFLEEKGYDAVVLGRSESLAWFTAGGDLGQGLDSEIGSVVLYVNKTSRAVICDNVQSARVFEEELAGLGFQLKESPWHDNPFRIVNDLARGKHVAADVGGFRDLASEREALKSLRWPLTKRERRRLRELGRALTLAVEATCRNFQPGEAEADVAGHLAHRLIREGVVPLDLRVAGDDRLARYRQPSFKAAPIEHRAVISAVGRRAGVCAAVSRVVSFGPVSPEVREAHALAAMVDATCIYFSRPGEPVAEIFRRARRIYEKFQRPDEWLLDYQGFVVGYTPREAPLLPESDLILSSDLALAWSPSVGSTRSGDTIVIDGRGFEVVTEAQSWPLLEVTVKGYTLPRPGILER